MQRQWRWSWKIPNVWPAILFNRLTLVCIYCMYALYIFILDKPLIVVRLSLLVNFLFVSSSYLLPLVSDFRIAISPRDIPRGIHHAYMYVSLINELFFSTERALKRQYNSIWTDSILVRLKLQYMLAAVSSRYVLSMNERARRPWITWMRRDATIECSLTNKQDYRSEIGTSSLRFRDPKLLSGRAFSHEIPRSNYMSRLIL